MKRKASFIISYICVLFLAVLGCYQLFFADKEAHLSEKENRMLQAFPEFSLSSVFSGSFSVEFEAYLSDSFIIRDQAADFSGSVMKLFDLRKAETPMVELDGAALVQLDESAETQPPQENIIPQDENSTQEKISAEAADASIWLINADGSYQTYQYYPAADIAHMAQVLNKYRDCLPADGTVHFICPPTSDAAFKLSRGICSDWGSDVDDVMQPLVDEGVFIYDATDILRPYAFETYIYPTQDWHWHPFSASAAAAAMLARQGVPALDYYEYDYYINQYGKSFEGEALRSLAVNQEEVPLLEPLSPVQSYVIRHLTEKTDCVFMTKNAVGYRMYLGGTYSPWRLFVTGFHTGRSALVIGDSFSNSFIPYLCPYYDKVLSTDFRDGIYISAEAGANVKQYIEEYGIDDVYVVFCTLTSISGKMPQDYMERYLELDYSGGGSN